MRLTMIVPAVVCAALVACADLSPTVVSGGPALNLERSQTGAPLTLHCDTYDFNLVGQTQSFLHVTLSGTCQIAHLGRATVFIEQTDNATGFDPQTNNQVVFFRPTNTCLERLSCQWKERSLPQVAARQVCPVRSLKSSNWLRLSASFRV